MCFFLHLQLVVRLYTPHPAVGSTLLRLWVECAFEPTDAFVCLPLCVCVCFFTRQTWCQVIKIAVMFPEWFSPRGKWRGNKLLYNRKIGARVLCSVHTENTIISLWTQFLCRVTALAETSPANWNLKATTSDHLQKWVRRRKLHLEELHHLGRRRELNVCNYSWTEPTLLL